MDDSESQRNNTNSQNYVYQMITTFLERISQALTESGTMNTSSTFFRGKGHSSDNNTNSTAS